MNNIVMVSEVGIKFIERPKTIDGYLHIATIKGCFHSAVDDLNGFLKERKAQLLKDGRLSENCITCFRVFGIERQADGVDLLFKACCGIQNVLSVGEIKAHLHLYFKILPN